MTPKARSVRSTVPAVHCCHMGPKISWPVPNVSIKSVQEVHLKQDVAAFRDLGSF